MVRKTTGALNGKRLATETTAVRPLGVLTIDWSSAVAAAELLRGLADSVVCPALVELASSCSWAQLSRELEIVKNSIETTIIDLITFYSIDFKGSCRGLLLCQMCRSSLG